MIITFIVSLFLTFIIVRILAYCFHDMKNYGTKNEKSKTITGLLRIKTGFDWHHFHFGILILIMVLPILFVFGLTKLNVILLAIGISMVIDQAVPIVYRKSNYFRLKNLLISFMFHVLISIIAILIRSSL
jgi:hypothetical protein